MLYCLDANLFFTADNLYYPMDYCPAYWDMIDKHIEDGSVFILDQVYQELTKGDSDVSEWIKERKDSGLVQKFHDESTQEEYKKIVDHVARGDYKPEVIAEFLTGADPWIIAACKAHDMPIGYKRDIQYIKKESQDTKYL